MDLIQSHTIDITHRREERMIYTCTNHLNLECELNPPFGSVCSLSGVDVYVTILQRPDP